MRKQEPDQHSYSNHRYQWLPNNVLPRIWCPCGGRMRPTKGDEYPHQFQCENCTANIDMHPPDQGWDPCRCGVLNKGVRCGAPLSQMEGEVCRRCRASIAVDYFLTSDGQQRLLQLVAQQDVQAEINRQRRARDAELAEKRAAREAELRDEAGHVVYYARLGANHIKIGTTGDLPRRMVELRVVNVSNLLAAEPGGYGLERQRHDQFKKWRYQKRKEDFGEGPDLLEHIRSVRAEHGDPYQLAAQLDKIPTVAPHSDANG